MSFNPFSLDYIYYPVSGIMWVWHKLFGLAFGSPANVWSWVLSVIFLVFTLRLILFKPFLKQMDSQIKMQSIQPEMKRIREKFKDDKRRQSEELMKLNKETGVNPLASCLPALLQLPVFISLYHVLRSFNPGQQHNYFFDASDINSFIAAKLFGGAPLSAWIRESSERLTELHGDRGTLIAVGVPLAIVAGIMTYLSSRRSIGRQKQMNPEAANQGQAAIMNKLMLYVFPVGVFVSAFLFPLPLVILFYYMANNSWTFGQLWYSHRRQDRQKAAESLVVEQAKEAAAYSKPRPGAKPTASKRPVMEPTSLTKKVVEAAPRVTPPAGSGRGSTRPQPGQKPVRSPASEVGRAPVATATNDPQSPVESAPEVTVRSGSATSGARPGPGSRPVNRNGRKQGRR